MLTHPIQTNEDVPLVRRPISLNVGRMGCWTNAMLPSWKTAQDWQLSVDLKKQLRIPQYIVGSTPGPDILLVIDCRAQGWKARCMPIEVKKYNICKFNILFFKATRC